MIYIVGFFLIQTLVVYIVAYMMVHRYVMSQFSDDLKDLYGYYFNPQKKSHFWVAELVDEKDKVRFQFLFYGFFFKIKDK